MTLSQLLAEVEPEHDIRIGAENGPPMVDRASYDKLKAIAVELAKCIDAYASAQAGSYPLAKDTSATVRKMLGEK